MATRSYAVAAIGLLFLLAGCDSDVARSGEGPATSLDGCPAPPEGGGTDEFDEPYADLPDEVPEGATSARLCPGGGTAMDLPADVLSTGVDDLVATVNAQPEQDTSDGYACTADAGFGYRIKFDYPDGSTFLISAGFYGCDSVVAGDGYRDGPGVVLTRFVDLVAAQREGQSPPKPSVEGDLRCQTPGWPPEVPRLGAPEDAVAAALCRATETDQGWVTSSSPVREGELRVLVDDLATHQVSADRRRCPGADPVNWLVASTAWGDRVEIYEECGTAEWRLPNDKIWTPGPQTVGILDRLVSETRRDR